MGPPGEILGGFSFGPPNVYAREPGRRRQRPLAMTGVERPACKIDRYHLPPRWTSRRTTSSRTAPMVAEIMELMKPVPR
jgi:hypothetical protein